MNRTLTRTAWWLSLTAVGGLVGMQFANSQLLEAPIAWITTTATYGTGWLADTALSRHNKRWLLLVIVSIVGALPKILVGGSILGVLATKVPYPRVLLYSVLVWPCLYLVTIATFWMPANQVQAENGLSDTAFVWQREFYVGFLFFIAASLLFLLVASIASLASRAFVRRLQRPTADPAVNP